MRRIQRDICHEEFIKSLTTGENPLFREIWRIMLFAAALGIKQGERRPLNKVDSGKGISESYFNNPGWHGFLYLIGVSESGDSECLKNTEDAQEILILAFEEYANHGLYSLRERIESISNPLEGFVSLLQESNQAKPSEPIIDDLI